MVDGGLIGPVAASGRRKSTRHTTTGDAKGAERVALLQDCIHLRDSMDGPDAPTKFFGGDGTERAAGDGALKKAAIQQQQKKIGLDLSLCQQIQLICRPQRRYKTSQKNLYTIAGL